MNQKGYTLLDLQSGHVFVSRNVIFFEHVFPFGTDSLCVPTLYPDHVHDIEFVFLMFKMKTLILLINLNKIMTLKMNINNNYLEDLLDRLNYLFGMKTLSFQILFLLPIPLFLLPIPIQASRIITEFLLQTLTHILNHNR